MVRTAGVYQKVTAPCRCSALKTDSDDQQRYFLLYHLANLLPGVQQHDLYHQSALVLI